MVGPIVSLDVLPADSPAEYAPAMVTACSEALSEGRCALARELPESAHPRAVALVLWQGETFLEVTVRVGQGDGKWVSRHLTFAESDSMSDRFTTVGLTAATLVGDTLPQPGPPPAPAPPPTSAPATVDSPEGDVQRAPRHRWLRAQLGALTGPGWVGAGWQRGGWATLGARLEQLPLLFYGLGSYATSTGPRVATGELSSSWLTVAVGAGASGAALGFDGSVTAEVGARRASAKLDEKSASDWEVPVRLRGMLAYPADGSLAVTAGGLLRLPPGDGEGSQTHVRAGFSAELLLGLEVRP